MATAYLTFICCIAKTVIDYLIQTSGTKYDAGPTFTSLPGPASEVEKDQPRLRRWSFALEEVITSFSDQQVVTGLAILIGGFSQLQWGIAAYHWLNVVNLAWFSAMTHLLTLTTLRTQIRGSKTMRALRVVGMGCLVVMLIVALVPVGFVLVDGQFVSNFPAWCLYRPHMDWKISPNQTPSPGDESGNYSWAYVIFAILVLLFGYVSRVRLLFGDEKTLVRDILHIPHLNLGNLIESRLEGLKEKSGNELGLLAGLEYKLIHSIFILSISAADLYTTTLWEVSNSSIY